MFRTNAYVIELFKYFKKSIDNVIWVELIFYGKYISIRME